MKIPPPTVADGLSPEYVAKWHVEQAVLDADPRTAGTLPRPPRLVARVLAEAKLVVALVGLTPESGGDHDRVYGVSHAQPFSGAAICVGLTRDEAEALVRRMGEDR